MGNGKKIFAILDEDQEYAYRFMEYLNQRRSLPFEIQAFTSSSALYEYAATHAMEILLIAENAYEDRMQELEIGKLIILTEGASRSETAALSGVYKYQASAEVVREVMNCYDAECAVAMPAVAGRKQAKLIGVYSPGAETDCTRLAVAVGLILAEKQRVLYLNLQSYAGIDTVLGRGGDKTLSDLLYFRRQQQGSILFRLNGVLQTIQNLDYIPPVRVEEDLGEVSPDEWLDLLGELQSCGTYEVLVADIGNIVRGKKEILQQCSCVFLPQARGVLARARQKEFLEDAQNWMDPDRLIVATLPDAGTDAVLPGKGYFEELTWGKTGEYVRKLIQSC